MFSATISSVRTGSTVSVAQFHTFDALFDAVLDMESVTFPGDIHPVQVLREAQSGDRVVMEYLDVYEYGKHDEPDVYATDLKLEVVVL